jgi:uncharacterized protein (DUF305 family)
MNRTTAHPGVMKRHRRRSRLAAAGGLVIALALVLSGCITVVTGNGGPRDGELPAGANRADVMFVHMMIPHHEQAVEMSELMLGRDDIDDDIVTLADQIISAQGPEIELMERWLDDWGAPSMPGGGHGGHGMGGMLTDDELDAIRDAEGAEAERLYLEGMIEHHDGAIDMARDVLDDGESVEVAELARAIIDSQRAEIELMRTLLATR